MAEHIPHKDEGVDSIATVTTTTIELLNARHDDRLEMKRYGNPAAD